MSHVMRHISHAKKKWEKVVELVGEGSVVNGPTPSSFYQETKPILQILDQFRKHSQCLDALLT